MMAMQRLDIELISRGIAKSREKAKEYIKSGKIRLNDKPAAKPSIDVNETDVIEYLGESEKYVGRGGFKLEKALSCFDIDISDCICVDIGASTGGFTDCMLQNGAKKVYAVDVGHGQLAEKLARDGRVVNIEGVNVKALTDKIIDEAPDFVCADLSFISCRYAAEAAHRLLKSGGKAVILIKPQFEAGREKVGKKGVVRDPAVHLEVLENFLRHAKENGFTVLGITYSPIRGPEGNIEYLGYLKKGGEADCIPDLRALVDASHSALKEGHGEI